MSNFKRPVYSICDNKSYSVNEGRYDRVSNLILFIGLYDCLKFCIVLNVNQYPEKKAAYLNSF